MDTKEKKVEETTSSELCAPGVPTNLARHSDLLGAGRTDCEITRQPRLRASAPQHAAPRTRFAYSPEDSTSGFYERAQTIQHLQNYIPSPRVTLPTQEMPSDRCAHKDLRVFDDTICCLSCGMIREFAPEKASENALTSTIKQVEPDCKPHTYRNLARDRDEIRLLELLPDNPLSPKSTLASTELGMHPSIRCRIMTVELDLAPPYVALSYTWATDDGDAALTQRMFVHTGDESRADEVVHITVNCETALRQIRDSSVTHALWVDAICINQNRISERNHQVSIMDRIYKRATRVHICINSPWQDYQAVMALFEQEDTVIETTFNGWGGMDIENWPEFAQLAIFFELRYFSRAWVLQEVILARAAILHLNNRSFPFPERTIKQLHKMYLRRAKSIPRLSQWANLLERDASIVSCLHTSLNSSASDPRDKVFAITGLLNTQVRAMISIDYLSTIEEVFTQAVFACIVERRDLEILCYANLPANEDLAATPVFAMRDFEKYLAHNGGRGKPKQDQRCLIERSEGSIPASQILPRLKVHTQILDSCIQSTSDGIKACITDWNYGSKASSWSRSIQLMWESFVAASHNLIEVRDIFSLRRSIRDLKDQSSSHEWSNFRTQYSIGFTSGCCLPGDVIAIIEGASRPCLLREVGTGSYRIVGSCCLWATRKLEDPEQVKSSEFWTTDEVKVVNRQAWEPQMQVVEIY